MKYHLLTSYIYLAFIARRYLYILIRSRHKTNIVKILIFTFLQLQSLLFFFLGNINVHKLLLYSTDYMFVNHDVISWLLLTLLFFVNFLVGTIPNEMPISSSVETTILVFLQTHGIVVTTPPAVHFKDVVSFLRIRLLTFCIW